MFLLRRFALPAALAGFLLSLVTPVAAATGPVWPTCAEAGLAVTPLHGPRFYVDLSNSPVLRGAYAGYRVGDTSGVARDNLWVALTDFTGGAVSLGQGQPHSQQIPRLTAGGASSEFFYLTASQQSTTRQTHAVGVWQGRPGLPGSDLLCTTAGGFTSVDGTIKAAANKLTSVSVSTAEPRIGSTFSITVTGSTGTVGDGTADDPRSFWMSPAASGNWPASAYRLESTRLSFDDGTLPHQDTLRVRDLLPASKDYTAVYRFRAVGFTGQAAQVLPVQQIASGTQIKHTDLSSVASLPAINPATNDLRLSASASPEKLPGSGGGVHLAVQVTGSQGSVLDGFEYTLSGGTTVTPGSVRWNGEPVDDPVRSGSTLYFQGPFSLRGADDRLDFDVDVPATAGTHEGAIVARVGDAQIDTTLPLTDNAPARTTVNVNTAPVASDDSGVTAAGRETVLDVLGNDVDADDDDLTVTEVSAPAHGAADTDGARITYVPADGFAGDDRFTYTVSDRRGGTATGVVLLDVKDVPAPSAADDTATVAAGGSVTIPVLDNDTGIGLGITDVTGEGAAISESGTALVYTAPADQSGERTLTYTVEDDHGLRASARVTVTVTPADPVVPEPEAGQELRTRPDRVTTTRAAGPVTLAVLANDVGTGLVLDSVGAAAGGAVHGEATVTGDRLRYNPAGDFTGIQRLTYRVRDALGQTVTGEVTVVVRNVTPRLQQPAMRATTAGARLRIPVSAQDADGDALVLRAGTATGSTGAARGVRASAGAGESFVTVRVADTFSGRSAVPLTVTDGHGGRDSRTLHLLVRPRAPRGLRAGLLGNPAAQGRVGRPRFVGDRPVSRVLSTGVHSTVAWSGSPTATVTSYEVAVNGDPACRTPVRPSRRQSCTVRDLALGADDRVTVRAVGAEGVRSSAARVPVSGSGSRHLLAVVYFPTGEFHLDRSAVDTLATVAARADRAGYDAVRMVGHTDWDGTHTANRTLSLQRAREVRRYLLAHSTALTVPAVSGRGETAPAASNATARGKAVNRRVEIYVH